MPGLPRSCVWVWYNEDFVPAVPAPTSLGNPTPPPFELPSSFLSGPGVGMGWCLYLDGANNPLGGQSQPFIQNRGGSGISPAETGPRRQGSLMGEQKPPRPKGSHLSRILLRNLGVGPVLPWFFPPLWAPGRRQVAMVSVTTPPAWPGVPQACPQVARGCHLEWRIERKPLAVGSGAHSVSPPQPQSTCRPSPFSLQRPSFSPSCHTMATCCVYPF